MRNRDFALDYENQIFPPCVCVWSKREKGVDFVAFLFIALDLLSFSLFFSLKNPLRFSLCFYCAFLFFFFISFFLYVSIFSSPLSFSCFQLHFLVLISRFFLCSASNFCFCPRTNKPNFTKQKKIVFFFLQIHRSLLPHELETKTSFYQKQNNNAEMALANDETLRKQFRKANFHGGMLSVRHGLMSEAEAIQMEQADVETICSARRNNTVAT